MEGAPSLSGDDSRQDGVVRRARTASQALPRRESTAALIRRALRDEIVNMARKPGEPISEKAIAAAYGVSRTPVREALLSLSEERLVDIFPQSGTFVARIPLAELPDAMLVRESLETTIVEIAARVATDCDIAELKAQLDSQRQAALAENRAAFHQCDETFHATLARIAGYPGVWSLVQKVKYQIDRFRHMTLTMAGRGQAIVGEHQAIVDAIAARNPARAKAMMDEHLATVRTGLADARALNPDYFTEDAPRE